MQKRQAEIMISATVKRFKPTEKGNNVTWVYLDWEQGSLKEV